MGEMPKEHERLLKLFMQIANEARLLKEKEYCNHHCGEQLETIIEASEIGIEIFLQNRIE